MNILYHPVFLTHDTADHPENARRLLSLGDLPVTDIPSGEDALHLVHTPEYIRKIKALGLTGGKPDPDTVVSAGSYEAACRAVGATMMAAEAGDFALVRPPGHHAFPDRSGGFCIFNNIAIAAAKLAADGRKVFIFDFDGHLGDGTEHIFFNSDRVLYASLHQAAVFPGGGAAGDIGYGKGAGFTMNVPLPARCGDDAFLRASDAMLDIATQFKPDIVGVSAGFDGHHSDPLLSLNLTVDTYYDLGTRLRERFGQVFAVLEGGYNLEFFPKCIANFMHGVNGRDKEHSETRTETMLIELEQVEVTIAELSKNLAPYWNV
jgi:acetoin utilization deacetylase AcuC-like enzyme